MNQNNQIDNSTTPVCHDETPVDVLIVDDEENSLAALKRRLGKLWSVHCATSADEGLSILEKHRCAIVISDFHMPLKDGIEFFTHLHQTHPDTIRIMLTGDVDRTTVIRAVNQGHIFRFLNKPCPPETVEIALQDGIEIYKLQKADPAKASPSTTSHHSDTDAPCPPAATLDSPQADASTAPSLATNPASNDSVRSGLEDTKARATSVDRIEQLLNVIADTNAPIDFAYDSALDSRTLPLAVIRRILGSLTAHARDLTHGHGRLRVRISSIDSTTCCGRLHPSTTTGGHIVLEVSNLDWRSSPETARAKFKDLIQRLGAHQAESDELKQVAQLVEAHHGWIQLQSCAESRTLVRVYLPELRLPAIPNSFQP